MRSLWLLPTLIACAPPPPEPVAAPALAGCRVEEARFITGDDRPWRLDLRAWDADGHLVLDDRTLLPGDDDAMHEVRTSTWAGGHLVEETERLWQEPQQVPTLVSRHTLDDRGLPSRTRVTHQDDRGAETEVGTFDWRWDPEGHLSEKALSDPDGTPVQVLVERWERQVRGWLVDREETWADGTPLTAEYRELDDEERPLRIASDWDADGTVEELLLWTLDEDGRARTLDRSGTGVIDSRCDYTWRGDDLVTESCWDDFRAATYVTTWTHAAPGRPSSARVEREGEVTETWSYDWDCPAG